MNLLKRHLPSPAMIVALVALFVALGGAAYAGVTLSNNSVKSATIKNGEVKTADLTNSAVTNLKLKNNAVNSAKVKNGSLEAADLSAAAQAALKGLKGDKGDKGDPGTALAYALVNGTTGAVTLSKAIATANVNHFTGGGYCISGLAFTPQNVVVSPESPGGNFDPEVGIGVGPSSCPAGTQVRVFLRNSAGVLTDKTFFVLLN